MGAWALFIYTIAGLGAGFATGTIGLSAATIITPMLVTFLKFPAYQAVTISLMSDVLASAIAAITYARNKNIDYKTGILMLAAIFIFTILGSWLSAFLPNHTLGGFAVVMTLLIGLNFIYSPLQYLTRFNPFNGKQESAKSHKIKTLGSGVYIGLNCGILGGGGGMIMLFVFTKLFHYNLKKSVGTSTFVMTFTALIGSLTHVAIGGIPTTMAVIVCVITTYIGARYAANFANEAAELRVRKLTGRILTTLGIVMILFIILFH